MLYKVRAVLLPVFFFVVVLLSNVEKPTRTRKHTLALCRQDPCRVPLGPGKLLETCLRILIIVDGSLETRKENHGAHALKHLKGLHVFSVPPLLSLPRSLICSVFTVTSQSLKLPFMWLPALEAENGTRQKLQSLPARASVKLAATKKCQKYKSKV